MVLQTTTRGVGRVQKIQNGTILEQIEKNSEKTSLVSKYSKQDKTKCSNIALQQNGKKGESVQKQLLNELHQSEKFNLTHKTSKTFKN